MVLITEHEHVKLTRFKGKIITAEEAFENVVYTTNQCSKMLKKIFVFSPAFLSNA